MENKLIDFIRTSGDVFLIFVSLFVGDHLLLGLLPSFFVVWLVVLIWRLLTGLVLGRGEFLAQVTTFLVCLPLYLKGVFSLEIYYLFMVYAILFLNALPLFIRALCSRYIVQVVLLFAMFFLFEGLYTWGQRDGFVFGPNILYRVYLMPISLLAALIVMFSVDNRVVSVKVAALLIFLLFFPIVSTGSRGAGIIYILTVFTFIFLSIKMALRLEVAERFGIPNLYHVDNRCYHLLDLLFCCSHKPICELLEFYLANFRVCVLLE